MFLPFHGMKVAKAAAAGAFIGVLGALALARMMNGGRCVLQPRTGSGGPAGGDSERAT
ncbi:MAG: hypothetical protein AAFY66_03145 [Pseudomonadota bacterium]